MELKLTAHRQTTFLARKERLVLPFLFLVALWIRLPQLNNPPLDFHATRQYRSYLIARSFYYESSPAVENWRREVARLNRQREGILEPPVMEYLVSAAYRLAGGEAFWIPRLLNSLFWLLGGVFLYLIGTRIIGVDAALFSTAFYLLLPFSVSASRSFQPDPLMVLLMLASVWAVHLYHERPSSRRLWVAAVLSAAACLVKPVCFFFIFGAFSSLLRSFPVEAQDEGYIIFNLMRGPAKRGS